MHVLKFYNLSEANQSPSVSNSQRGWNGEHFFGQLDDIFEPPGRNELIVWKTDSRFFFLPPHTPVGRVRLARFARVRLLRHALPISLLILREKKENDCFAVYPCTEGKNFLS